MLDCCAYIHLQVISTLNCKSAWVLRAYFKQFQIFRQSYDACHVQASCTLAAKKPPSISGIVCTDDWVPSIRNKESTGRSSFLGKAICASICGFRLFFKQVTLKYLRRPFAIVQEPLYLLYAPSEQQSISLQIAHKIGGKIEIL